MTNTSRFGLVAAIALTLSATSYGGQILYGITDDDNLISINTTTGAGTLIGAITLGGNPIDVAPLGLASSGGNLYAYDTNNGLLRQIDPTTGAIVATVDLGIAFSTGEGDMTFRSDGTGYMASTLDDTGSFGSGTLLSFSTSPGSATVVNSTFGSYDGLAFVGNTLFGFDQQGDSLSTIDTTTGAETLVGATSILTIDPSSGFPIYGFGGLAYGPNDSVLYGDLSNFSASNLYTLDPSTGTGTLVGAIGYSEVDGLAFLATTDSTPEPSTLVLLSGALLAAGAFRKRFDL